MSDTTQPPRTLRQYEVHDKLGSGAGGTVYRAFDTHLHRAVVIKVLHRGGSVDAHTARLLEEARLASAIDHPNVCTVYETGEADGQPYLVMQYVPGRTLQALLVDGALPQPLALSLGVQIASGLAAAHRHGVLHRDLKPANVMVTDDGLAKILDFGLARRAAPASDPEPPAASDATHSGDAMSSRFGTTAYLAPEQFVTRRSTVQSDVWALGVILFQMATGRHPFWLPSIDQNRLSEAIQFHPVPSPTKLQPTLDPAFAEIILKALVKQPDDRFRHASDVRDALKTLIQTQGGETPAAPGEPSVPVPPGTDAPGRGGLIASLADRLLPTRTHALPENAVAVLPFHDDGTDASPPFYGVALADAIATRLAQVPTLLVRPPRVLQATKPLPSDPVDAGRQLAAAFVLTGRFARIPTGFHLSWRLLSVDADAVVIGQTTEVAADDLVTVQHRFGEEVFAALRASGALPISAPPQLRPAAAVGEAALDGEVAEDYLSARALLNSQVTRSSHERDLEQARRMFERVIERAPDFAPAHASLGLALTRYVRYGFGGVGPLAAAQQHLDRALALDPSNIEAKLYRAYTLLWRGEKEQARQDVHYLLHTAAYDAEVHIGAGVSLQLDGLLDEALHAFSTALRINPSVGPRVYNLRARMYLCQGHAEPARREIEKGLALEPRHTLLRTTDAVWELRHGDPNRVRAVLEGVVADDPHLRLAHPTLAIAYQRLGEPKKAAAIVTEDLLAVAAADGEMAYRVATYFAVAGRAVEALHWLRKAIYLGNHNAPWLTSNPDWEALRDHEGVRQTLEELAQMQRNHLERWRHVLTERRPK